MSSKIIIFANGQKPRKSFVAKELNSKATVIAADGGLKHCIKLEIVPDYIIGDFDSSSAAEHRQFPKAQIISKPDQYLTDMEKALELADSLNPEQIIIFSAVGKRTDHSASNLLFYANSPQSGRIQIYDRFGLMKILTSGLHRFTFKPGQIISLFSFGPVSGLTLTGFEYPLTKAGFPLFFVGVSNIVRSNTVTIGIGQGTLFMYERIIRD